MGVGSATRRMAKRPKRLTTDKLSNLTRPDARGLGPQQISFDVLARLAF